MAPNPGTDTGTPVIDIDTIYSNLHDLFDREVFEREIVRVQKEFHDLIDRSTAALFIAVQAGRIEPQERDLHSLRDSDQVTISGSISRIDSLRTFTRKDGTSGQVQSLFVERDGAEVRVSFWEGKEIDRIQIGEIRIGMTVKVINGRVKINNYGTTVNVGNFTKVTYTD
jgi:hypothetical protein